MGISQKSKQTSFSFILHHSSFKLHPLDFILMRYYYLIISLFSWLGLLLPPIAVKAVENPPNFFPSQELPDFWPPAQELVQEQINLIAAIEQALVSPDPNRVRLVRGQIFLHTFAVDRLLKKYYRIPSVLCSVIPGEFDNVPPVGSLNENQFKASRYYILKRISCHYKARETIHNGADRYQSGSIVLTQL